MKAPLAIMLLALLANVCPALADTPVDSIGLSAEKCFKEAPKSVMKLINSSARLDMIDYFDAGISKPSTNIGGGECYIVSREPYSIDVVAAQGVKFQFFVLDPTSSSPLIGVIQTIDTPVPDSNLTVYTSNWTDTESLKGRSVWKQPSIEEWVRPECKADIAKVKDQIPFILASYSFDPDSSTLTISNNLKDYFVPSDLPEALSMLKDSLSYTWNPKTKKFVVKK